MSYHAIKVKRNYSISWDINFEGFRSQLGQKNFFKTAVWLPHGQLWAIIEGQPHPPNVNRCVLHFRPEGHWKPRNKVGSLSPAERLVGIELGTFRFLLQRLNPLGHLSQRSWTVLWVDTKIRGLKKKHCTYLNFGLSFEFWDMKKPDSKFFRPDPESERLDI